MGNRQPVSFLIGRRRRILSRRVSTCSVNSASGCNNFNDQLSDMLNLMVNGLRAGYSTMQAMEAVSKELPTPICDEFRRVVQEMQIGIPHGGGPG